MSVFCVEPSKIGDTIASLRTTILGQMLFIKIEALLGRTQKNKNYESLREVCGNPKLDRRKILC